MFRIFGYLQTLWGPHSIDRDYRKHSAPPVQLQVARSQVRGRRLSSPTGHSVPTRGQLLQTPVGRSTRSLRKTSPIGRSSHRHRILLAPQTVVSAPTQHGNRDHPLPRLTRPILPRSARLAQGGRTNRMEHRGFSTATPAWLHTRRGAIGRTPRTFSPSVADLRANTFHPHVHLRPGCYKLREPDVHAPWTSTMTILLRKLLRIDQVGTLALHLLSNSLATTSYANYDNGMRKFAAFGHEEDIHPLHATTQSVVRYTTWLGLQGTVAAASLHQYYSAINKFFRDHQQQPIALAKLLADARRGLEMQQERLHAADSRLPLPPP
jgi:hypothetical protein